MSIQIKLYSREYIHRILESIHKSYILQCTHNTATGTNITTTITIAINAFVASHSHVNSADHTVTFSLRDRWSNSRIKTPEAASMTMVSPLGAPSGFCIRSTNGKEPGPSQPFPTAT